MPELPELENHSSGLGYLHPCKKYKHHKKRERFKPGKPAFGIFACTGLPAFPSKAYGEAAQGHWDPNGRCDTLHTKCSVRTEGKTQLILQHGLDV